MTKVMTASLQNRRVVFINHTPPDSGDVSSLRMTRFAETFAERGAAVLLLTGSGASAGLSYLEAKQRLRDHEPGKLTYIPCRLGAPGLAAKARTGEFPTPLRQAVIGWHYALGGGVFPDWRDGAGKYLTDIADEFCPEVVIGTFGNTDTWQIAQTLARQSNAPWIADLKDNWRAFLPTGFANSIAGRFDDMAHMTVYSEAHLNEANRWFNGDKTVVYSGFDHLAASNSDVAVDAGTVSLIGSIYDGEGATVLLQGLTAWHASRDQDVTLCYAGHDGERIATLATVYAPEIGLEIPGNLPPVELSNLLQRSMANAYTVNPASLFQQKPLELLAIGRPVIAVPGEGPETHEIARKIGGKLVDAATATDLAAKLSEIEAGPAPTINEGSLNAYTWGKQADILSDVIETVLKRSP